MAAQVLNEFPLGAQPLLNVIRRGRGEHVEVRVDDDGPHGLLVVREGGAGLPRGQVPQADGAVVATGDYLGEKV